MLAQKRSLRLKGVEVERTPLLVPSFSSKGFPEVADIIKMAEEFIEGPMLISAYDLHYKHIAPPFAAPALIFLDSGGYEAGKDADLSDLAEQQLPPQAWSREDHQVILRSWNASVPTVVISYDHPKDRIQVTEQIHRAQALPVLENTLREILLKPETAAQRFLSIERLFPHIHELARFDIIGITEKEIGSSILERMKNIAHLRMALNKAGLDTPIHVFGSLDTLSTPLYFVAGADIFDGLTWLRFGYREGQTLYRQNFGALALGVNAKAHMIDARCWVSNYYYLKELELEMRRFLKDHNFDAFKYHGPLIEQSLQSVAEAVGI
jgi:hypothetical protein